MARQSRRERGVTVVEVGLVGAICSVIALGAALLMAPRFEAEKTDSALQTAAKIHEAAARWRGSNPSGCPTITTLLHERQLETGVTTEDPWGNRFRLRCSEAEISVMSPGKDGRPGTPDDLQVPKQTRDG